jgi:hypothetical protein
MVVGSYAGESKVAFRVEHGAVALTTDVFQAQTPTSAYGYFTTEHPGEFIVQLGFIIKEIVAGTEIDVGAIVGFLCVGSGRQQHASRNSNDGAGQFIGHEHHLSPGLIMPGG